MKITYLHQYFNTPEMSGGTRSFEMGRRLVAMGHEVDMITTWRDGSRGNEWFETQEAGMRVHWLPVDYSNHMSYQGRIRAFARFALRSARKAASIHSDVVFATSTPLTIALPGVFASRRRRVPFVFEVRDLWPELPIAMGALKNPLLRKAAVALEKFAYRNASSVVALSPGMRDGVAAKEFPIERIEMIPNSSDLEQFYPDAEARSHFRGVHGIKQDAILVVYTGTFGRINGVDYLARLAAELMHDDRFQFLAVGGGQEYDSVQALARSLGCLDKNLQLMPRIPKKQMHDVLAAADIATSLFLPLPEMEANSANKFFDGLAAGCCMAVNYGGWHEELLEDSTAGLRLARSVTDAARQLQDLASCPGAVERAGRQARTLAEDCFARDALASRLESTLRRAVDGRAT